mmetsp:Transcript_21994/g.63410  ORF Transcript_21994/g.63410 Transcript_21994/m.63410 type:complete len:203 (+) Transcript_21994:2-610(+)
MQTSSHCDLPVMRATRSAALATDKRRRPSLVTAHAAPAFCPCLPSGHARHSLCAAPAPDRPAVETGAAKRVKLLPGRSNSRRCWHPDPSDLLSCRDQARPGAHRTATYGSCRQAVVAEHRASFDLEKVVLHGRTCREDCHQAHGEQRQQADDHEDCPEDGAEAQLPRPHHLPGPPILAQLLLGRLAPAPEQRPAQAVLAPPC